MDKRHIKIDNKKFDLHNQTNVVDVLKRLNESTISHSESISSFEDRIDTLESDLNTLEESVNLLTDSKLSQLDVVASGEDETDASEVIGKKVIKVVTVETDTGILLSGYSANQECAIVNKGANTLNVYLGESLLTLPPIYSNVSF
jgi:hypothetical protein